MIRLLLALAILATPAHAETLRAKPETLAAVLKAAAPGDTVVLDQNRLYSDVTLPQRDHAVPVEIVATNAKFRSLTIRNTAGWRWIGGTVDAPLPPVVWVNVMIDGSRRIEIAGVTLTGGQTGVLVTRGSDDITLRGNIATGLRSDGFNIATATRVILIGNTCTAFRPIPPVYDGNRLVKDGTHPDCIQMWSEAGKPPTSDILILGNRISGTMQGITNFGASPVDRVRVERNEVEIGGFWWGIAMNGVPGAEVRHNSVRTLPGSTAMGRPGVRTSAVLQADKGVRCGNDVQDQPADGAC